jgi:DNA-binding ferritin-like protein (Dps family)
MYNNIMSTNDDEIYTSVHDAVDKLLDDYYDDQMVIASYLFASAIKLWRENLDDEDYYAILEEVFDNLLSDDDPTGKTLH